MTEKISLSIIVGSIFIHLVFLCQTMLLFMLLYSGQTPGVSQLKLQCLIFISKCYKHYASTSGALFFVAPITSQVITLNMTFQYLSIFTPLSELVDANEGRCRFYLGLP